MDESKEEPMKEGEFEKIEAELEEKSKMMHDFVAEMKARRIKEGIEEENPFKTQSQASLDKQLE